MDIANILNEYLEVASELGNDSAISLLNDFINKTNNQRYELPLIGQFSAGKSATINHLLGRDLLPTKSIETTAFATFISYSESEYATLETIDGSIENISFDEIKLLDNIKVKEQGRQIKSLNIGVNCDLLKSGLTFVDTPGVNTIITTHIEITERILKSAQCIVYVIAKNITDEDALMIQTIEAQNIPVIFVRTHIDDIKSTEENWETTVRLNEKGLVEKLGHPIRFFAISNDTSRSEYDNNFTILKDYLSKEIARNVKEVFEQAIIDRLAPIGKELESSIVHRKQTIEQSAGKSIEDIEKQKSKIEVLVGNWNDKLKTQQNLISKKANEVKNDVLQSILKTSEAKIREFDVAISNTDGNASDLNLMINDHLTKASSSMNKKVEEYIQDGANSICRRIGEEMHDIVSELHTIGLDGDCTFDMSVARDYADRQRSIDEEFLAKVEQINEIKERVYQQSGLSEQARTEIENAISHVEEQITAYKKNVEAVENSYEPQYIQKQSKLGPIGKTIGDVLDIAMLFIPGAGWTKAGKWVGKLGKSGSMLRKVGKGLQTGAKILAKTDAAKDAATLLGGLKNATDKMNGNLKKTSIFDYVSLSYWFEKVGEQFDPSTCELDQEYEQQFQLRRAEAEAELQKALDQKKIMIENLAKLNGEKWKSERELAEAENMSKDLVRKTEAIKASLESEKERAIRESLLSQAIKEFQNRINEYVEILNHKSVDMIESVFASIISAADLKISSQLTSLSDQLSEIVSNKDEFIMNRDQMLAHYTEMIAKLKTSR
jgi:GTP-binding protein EngB required for normal cell division